MVILTSAHSNQAKSYLDPKRKWREFSFGSIIRDTMRTAQRCGYRTAVYDLGSLGFGEKYALRGERFDANGFYRKEPVKGYKSKALFKPEIVRKCLSESKDFTVYLDGDALLAGCLPEILTDDYDIGVTLRDRSELGTPWHEEYFEIAKYVNAGVIFFNYTEETLRFVNRWDELTHEVGNDQMALNRLTTGNDYPTPYSIKKVGATRVKYFPCKKYNFYYFNEGWPGGVKIIHFKGDVRHFYPLTWKKRLYCQLSAAVRKFAGRR